MADSPSFHWADYLIFILVLVISTAIGIFFAWRDRKKQNAADFLLGGRKMGILPVSLSLMATLLSAVMVLGVPAEVYYNGSIYWIILFSNFIVYPIAAHAFLPVFHNLGLTSAYEVSVCSRPQVITGFNKVKTFIWQTCVFFNLPFIAIRKHFK